MDNGETSISAWSGSRSEMWAPRFMTTEHHAWSGQRLTIRPGQRNDGPLVRAFLDSIDQQNLQMRMMGAMREISEAHIRRVVKADHVRDVSFVAVAAGGEPRFVGVVEAHFECNESANFAVLVSSGMQRQGIGTLLMDKLVRYCRERGIRRLDGETTPYNIGMITLARRLGFQIAWSPAKHATDLVLEFGQSCPRLDQVRDSRPLDAARSG